MRPRKAFKYTCVRFAIAFVALLGLSLPARVSAQMVGATVSGTVVDPTGGVVPNVKIVLQNEATGNVANAVTNGVGIFTAPNISPGVYDISASAEGFSTLVRKAITLTVGQELVLNLTLQVGNTSTQIEVTTEAPTVDLANATVGGLVNAAKVEELPLNGRSWSDLAILEPGVHTVGNQPNISSTDRTKRGMGLELSIAGGRPQQNNYLMDGVNINNYTNAGPGSLLGGNLGTDAVGEFSVLTTNYSAEYGRTSGGVISAITKSGTNQFHGTAYEFLRNKSLDAANYIDDLNGNPKPPFQRNQYGGSIGGPIQKDKTFFFVDYEGVKQNLGSTLVATVPTPADVAAAEAAIAGTPDPNALLYLKTFWPASPTGIFSFAGHQVTGENFVIGKVDHTFSTKDRIFGTYLFDNSHQTEPDEMNNKLIQNNSKRQTVAFEWNHVFNPDWLNSFRLGFNRDNTASPDGATPTNPAAADLKFGFDPGYPAGSLEVDPYTVFSGGTVVSSPFEFIWNSYQIYENLYVTKGIHSLKLGGNVERIQQKFFGLDSPGGGWVFNSLPDFLSNHAASFGSDALGTESPRYERMAIAGAYIQDDIHFRPNLTFNVGLRYEFGEVPYEVDGKLANLRMLVSTPKTPPAPFLGSPYFRNPTKRDWEPRIGLAWDPFKNGKTSVRAGFGMFDVLPMPAQMGAGLDSSSPFAEKLNIDSPASLVGLFPNQEANAGVANTAGYYLMDFNPKRPLVMQWNLNIEHQLTPNTTITIGYVGSRGEHLWIQSTANIIMPMPGTLQWPCPGGFTPMVTAQGATINYCPKISFASEDVGNNARPDPNTGTLSYAQWAGWYSYHALQVQIRKVMSHGFQIQGNYTWAKNIDIGSGAVAADQYTNSVTGLLWFCQACRRSLADTDVRNNITIDYLWNIPTAKSFATPLKAVLGNWQAGGILTIENGRPFTVLISGDPLNALKTQQHPDRISGSGCATGVNLANANQYIKVECFTPPNPSTQYGDAGRNSLIGPGLVALDFSLFKNIPIKKISEASNLQFRAECFNCTNRVNLSPPVDHNVIFDALGNPVTGAGLIDSTSTTSRQIQLALKLSF